MAKEEILEKQFVKQMGCMTGFFQIFDRHQIISGKRLSSTKRLPHSKILDEDDDSEMSGSSTPVKSREIVNLQEKESSENVKSPAVKEVVPPLKSPHRLSVIELKGDARCSRKFARENARLSLDSRAIVDSKGSVHPREIRTDSSILSANRCDSPVSSGGGGGGGGGGGDFDDKQRRSPSVIARLMGLEQLPEPNPAQLRRSASESRAAARDYRSIDNAKSNNQTHSDFVVQSLKSAGVNQAKRQFSTDLPRSESEMEQHSLRNTRILEQHQKQPVNRGLWRSQQHYRKSYFDAADVFPEPKLTMSPYAADIVKKLHMRGIDEASKDLETLKQILEALQFKGLLHSRRMPEHRNFVYDRYLPNECSPRPYRRTFGTNSPPPKSTVRRNLTEKLSSVSISPRRDRPHFDSNLHRLAKTTSLSIETPRRQSNDSSRRTSPVQSPRMRSKPDQSKSHKRPTAEKNKTQVTEDESSSISESTFSTSSQPDTERSKTEGYIEGKSLLERCDKLLHNIADMNAVEMQPSPVSVLDSTTFYKEDYPSSPSPVLKRSIDFKDISSEFEEEWGNSSSIYQPDESKSDDVDVDVDVVDDDMDDITDNEDPDFIYISQIIRAFRRVAEDSDVFLFVEKQHYLQGNYNCKASILHRRLIFDMITEILERNRKLPPWKAFPSHTDSLSSKTLLQKIWTEFERIRHRGMTDDVFEIICGVLKKDLEVGGGGWEGYPMELSEAVLDIERLVFKDLIGETIREIAVCLWRSPVAVAHRRKLVY